MNPFSKVLSLLMICSFSLNSLFASAFESSPNPIASLPGQMPMESSRGVKVPFPTDLKIFEMPGVVLLKNGQWQGVDYLGYLSNQITVDVEIIKGDNTPAIATEPLVSYARKLLNSVDIIRQVAQRDTPPMPLLHLLLVVYPVEKDRVVIFAQCRLFEEIQIMRASFVSNGFWQGITWESLNVSISSGADLQGHLKDVVDKMVSGFIERYQIYNPEEQKLHTVSAPD